MGSPGKMEDHGDTMWPTIEAAHDLEWRLRYVNGAVSITDKLFAASIISAYIRLRGLDSVKRHMRELELVNVVSKKDDNPTT